VSLSSSLYPGVYQAALRFYQGGHQMKCYRHPCWMKVLLQTFLIVWVALASLSFSHAHLVRGMGKASGFKSREARSFEELLDQAYAHLAHPPAMKVNTGGRSKGMCVKVWTSCINCSW